MALGVLTLDSMQSTMGFKTESKALGSSVKATKEMQKVVKAEVSSPLEQMTKFFANIDKGIRSVACLLYTSPSPRDRTRSRMPSSA